MAGRIDPRLGSVVRGRYRLERVLGAGGMATVYLAVHRNGHRVALKILHPELCVSAEHRERFIRESYVANAIDHPGAVRVLDDDIADDGAPYLVIELLRGETLEAYLRRQGPLPPAQVLAIGYAICDVLAAAHARGVVHRDIKPDNLFLTADGALKILDFGIARERVAPGVATRTGHLIGTPGYLPPEQALGRRESIDGRTDLWAVGATLFTLILGHPVHHGDTPEALIVRAATEPAPPLRSAAPELHPAIAAVLDRALAFAQHDRYADALAMAAALADAHLVAFGVPLDAAALPRGEPLADLAAAVESAATLASDPGLAHTVVDTQPTPPDATSGALPQEFQTSDTFDSARPPRSWLAAHSQPVEPDRRDPPSDRVQPEAHASAGPTRAGALTAAPRARPGPRGALRVGAAVLAVIGLALAGRYALDSASRQPERFELPSADPGASPPPAECASNAECVDALGVAAICRKDDRARCVPLASDHCRVLADPHEIADDTTFWFGAMYPSSDASMDYGAEAVRLVELARRDFAELTGGLPPLRPGGRPRPIGVVLCDDTRDHHEIAAHLVDEVGVPAIIGFGRSKEVLELASDHFVPKGVLALASNTASMLTSIPHPPGEPRLVYRVTTSAAMSNPPRIALLRGAIEPLLRGDRRDLGPAGALRIAVLRADNASGISHNDAIFSELARTRGAAPEELRAFVVADSPAPDPAVIAAVAADVIAFRPHVVVDAGAPSEILLALERGWGDDPRPMYAYGGVNERILQTLAAEFPDVRRRLHLIASRESPTAAKVQAHYRATYGGTSEISATPYDAFYVLVYAAIAVGDAPLSGRALARAIARLVPPGEPIEVGPAGIYPAINALARGASIDLQGTLTTLDFDPQDGDATAEFALRCLSDRASVGGSITYESETRFDPSTAAMRGDGRCP